MEAPEDWSGIDRGIENKSDAEKLKEISILLPNQTLHLLRNLDTLGCYTLNILWGQRFSLVRICRIACDIFRDAQLCPFFRAHDHRKDTQTATSNCTFCTCWSRLTWRSAGHTEDSTMILCETDEASSTASPSVLPSSSPPRVR